VSSLFIYKGKATLKDDTRLQSVLEAASRLEIAPLLADATLKFPHRTSGGPTNWWVACSVINLSLSLCSMQ
jgi:hypothetical protein